MAKTVILEIDRKEYARQWEPDRREVYKIGINFLSPTRNIGSWTILSH